jgi:glutathione S-transferase
MVHEHLENKVRCQLYKGCTRFEEAHRLALNIKKLPFETVWVEGPDIEKTVKALGGKPTAKRDDGKPVYTLPVIQDLNTSILVVESFEIAQYLDVIYPDTPSLLLGTPALHRGFLQALNRQVVLPLMPLAIGPFPPKLNKASEDHWAPEAACYGYPQGEQLAEVLKQVEAGLSKVASWVDEGQVLVGGSRPVFADTYLAAWLISLRWSHGIDSDVWKAFESWQSGRWAKFMKEMKQYESI